MTLGALEAYTDYPGELEADAVDLSAKITARVDEVRVRIGDEVKGGALVAKLDDAELHRQVAETQAEVRVAEATKKSTAAQLAVARSELSRTEPLREKNLVSSQHLDALRAKVLSLEADVEVAAAQAEQRRSRVELLQLQIRETRLVSPFDGIVAARHVDPGALSQPGKAIVRIVAKGPIRVRFRIPERDLVHLRPGQTVEVRLQATQDVAHLGRVARIAGEVSRSDRTVEVEAVLESGDEVFRPGMFAQVRALKARLESSKIVPASAVLERVENGRPVTGVFVDADGVAKWKVVRPVESTGERVAIEGDVESGQRVLTLGHEDLGDGARIEAAAAPEEEGERATTAPAGRLAP